METRTLIRFTLAAGMIAAAGGVGCSLVKAEDTGSSPDEVNAGEDVSQVLKSVLQLQGGCTAAKVGPKQLLVAARCVSGNAAYASGKTISFTVAAAGTVAVAAPDSGTDAAAAPKDAGARDAAPADSGAAPTPASNPNAKQVTIADVKIHPSYVATCTGDLCDFTKLAASDSPDIAVILLEEELETVPTIPVDLDPVGQADPLLAVTANCATFDTATTAKQKTVRTEAVPTKSVNHVGSPYAASPNLVSRLASSYVVTTGAGWRTGAPRLCKTDIGAPLFRAGSAAVAGVTSNYTTYGKQRLPVTTHHTRVDAASRFKIGDWLTTLGAETVHTCSESTDGCTKRTFDGGAPPGPTTEGPTEPGDGGGEADGGLVGDAATAPDAEPETPAEPEDTSPHQDQLPNEEPSSDSTTTSGEDDFTDAGTGKKKKKDEGGCSAAPGGTSSSSGGFAIGVALALGAILARRRR
jgi:MYXO-CTERM domain-containing protein